VTADVLREGKHVVGSPADHAEDGRALGLKRPGRQDASGNQKPLLALKAWGSNSRSAMLIRATGTFLEPRQIQHSSEGLGGLLMWWLGPPAAVLVGIACVVAITA
jgi:hypothetical protein